MRFKSEEGQTVVRGNALRVGSRQNSKESDEAIMSPNPARRPDLSSSLQLQLHYQSALPLVHSPPPHWLFHVPVHREIISTFPTR